MSSIENKILIKKTVTPGKIPSESDVLIGELAANVSDGKLFLKTVSNQITSIKEFLNSDDQYFIFDSSLSAVNTKFGNNTISQVFGTVLGGYSNDITGGASTVVNGEDNDISSDFSSIINGWENKILSTGDYSFIAGGKYNEITHENVFTLGSNLSSHAQNFTYVNNLSADGKIYGDGSELIGIISGDTEATTLVRANSANWDSTYTTVQSESANWGTGGTAQTLSFNSTTNDLSLSYGNTVSLESLAGVKGEFLPLSGGNMTGSLTAVNITSTGKFYGDGSLLTGIVAGDTEATTLVRDNSANWDSSYSTVDSLSSNWQTTFQASSAYVSSSPTGITGASALTKLLQITQAGYNDITPASDTLYIIVG